MYRTHLLTLAMLWIVLIFVAQAVADEESNATAGEDRSAAEQFAAIEQDYNADMKEFRTAYSAAAQEASKMEDKDAARRALQAVYQEKYPNGRDYAARYMNLAKNHPDDPVAVKALGWVMRRAGGGPESKTAIELLAKHHAESDQLLPVLQALTRTQPSDETETFLRTVAAENPDGDTKGMAKYALAKYLASLAGVRTTLEKDSDKVAIYKRRFGEPLVARLMNRSAQDLEAEAESVFEEIIAEHGDVSYGRGTLADVVEGDLFEIKYLAIGKVAPDIEGEDLDGVPFKLSDYRGNVVVIDFWGDW